jgi:hypothetical protein
MPSKGEKGRNWGSWWRRSCAVVNRAALGGSGSLSTRGAQGGAEQPFGPLYRGFAIGWLEVRRVDAITSQP